MKKVIGFLIAFLIMSINPVYASDGIVYTETLDTNSGATMGVSSGVTFIGEIDMVKLRPISRTYSIQLDTVIFADDDPTIGSSGLTNANPSGTGLTVDAGVSMWLLYGVSNTKLTETQWVAKGLSGTTIISAQMIGSGSTKEPHNFTPEFSRYLAILAYSGQSQFLVPKAHFAGQ